MVRSGSRTEKCIVDSGLDELKQTMTAEEKSFGRGCGHQRRRSRRILDGVREAGPEEVAYAVYGMLIYLTYYYWYAEHGSLKSHRQVSGDHS